VDYQPEDREDAVTRRYRPLNRQRDGEIGTYDVTNPLNFDLDDYNRRYLEPNESLNPFVARFGIRFQF
jgi:hypothetical protein